MPFRPMPDIAKLRHIHEALRVLKYHVLAASSRNPLLLREVLPAVDAQLLGVRRALGGPRPLPSGVDHIAVDPDSVSPEQVGLDIVELAVQLLLVDDHAQARQQQAHACSANIAAQRAFVNRLRTWPRQELDALVLAGTRCPHLPVLQSVLAGPRGSVLAIPHFGAYIWTLYYLASLASRDRQVLLLFDAPDHNPDNSPFVQAVARLESTGKVSVAHPDRRGLARCLGGLRQGATLLLFPDLCRDLLDTQYVALFERLLPVTPVAAKLAAAAAVPVLPVVGRLASDGRVDVHVAPPLTVPAGAASEVAVQTLRLFEAYDPICRDQVCCWFGIRDFAVTTLPVSRGHALQARLAGLDAGACRQWLRELRMAV